MNSVLTKILGGVLCVFAIVYFGYQAYMFTYDPYSTAVAQIASYTDQIEIDGIAVKDEEMIPNPASGVVKYTNTASQKVVAGMTVATVFANEQDISLSRQVDLKQEYVTMLSDLESRRASIAVNSQNVVKGVKEQQVSFVNGVQMNQFSGIESTQLSFLEQMLKQQVVLNEDISFQTQIDATNAEITSLQGQMSSEGTPAAAPKSGYFTRQMDGFEGALTKENITDLSLATVEGLLSQDVSATAQTNKDANVGKVITSTEWYFLATFDTKEADRLEKGQTVTLQFPNNTGYAITAEVMELNVSEDKDVKSVILLKSSNMNDGVVDVRVEHASVVFDTDKGIKVPKQAVRIVDVEEENEDGTTETVSQPGVYVNMGQVVKFKKVKIKYETNEFIISEELNDDTSYLQLYDDIILEGDNLYDNKPIR